jgi:hypothetical protein
MLPELALLDVMVILALPLVYADARTRKSVYPATV